MHKIIINKQARQSHFNNNNLAFRGQSEVIGICAFDVEYGLANRKAVRQRGGERDGGTVLAPFSLKSARNGSCDSLCLLFCDIYIYIKMKQLL